jgi:hypothetical protein
MVKDQAWVCGVSDVLCLGTHCLLCCELILLLFVCYLVSSNIVTLHGGRIGIQSEGEGRGSTFIVDMPINHQISPDPNWNSDHHHDYNSSAHVSSGVKPPGL